MVENGIMQKCIILNEKNADIIINSLDEYVDIDPAILQIESTTTHDILDTRRRIKDIKDALRKTGEVKVCWG